MLLPPLFSFICQLGYNRKKTQPDLLLISLCQKPLHPKCMINFLPTLALGTITNVLLMTADAERLLWTI